MRSSEVRRGALQALLVLVLGASLQGCAVHAPEQLALRDRIEQGALAPEDNPCFYTSERTSQVVVASASDPVLRLASSLDRQLVGAAGRGDVVALRQLIKDGAQVNAADEWGNTALLLAAREGDLETARTLLRAGAEVDGRGGAFTPLGQAALRGHTHMVRLLLRSGARVDATAQNEHTPLMTAVKLNHPEVVGLLLKAGASTQVKDRTGAGLLLVTINDDLPQVMAVLLGHGVDPNQADADGLSPLYWARQLQREALAIQLVNAGAQADAKRQTLRASRPYPKEDF
jgi:hypothetical protein